MIADANCDTCLLQFNGRKWADWLSLEVTGIEFIISSSWILMAIVGTDPDNPERRTVIYLRTMGLY